MGRDEYVKAGKIASTVREKVRGMDLVGKTALEVCDLVESDIKGMGARCAFPVNVSINEVAAHYTAEPGDQTVIGQEDTVKVDLGAHIDGYIADTAVTVNTDPMHEGIAETAEEALAGAMKVVRGGAKTRDIGRAIEDIIKRNGCKPIANLTGHSLGKYTIHAGKSIPNTWAMRSSDLVVGEAYACEPFVTTKDGLGFVRNGKTKNIFALVTRKKTKNGEANEMLEYIWNSFNSLPFARRWLEKWEPAKAAELLDVLVKAKAVHAYPVLLESAGKRVAQAEHTFIADDGGATVTTAA